MVPLINMELGEVVIGGVGAGLYRMLLFAIITVFVAGLMVGHTPEYLGKKIESREVKLTMLAILCLPLMMLGMTAIAVVVPMGLSSISTPDRTASPRCCMPTRRARPTMGPRLRGCRRTRPSIMPPLPPR